MNRQCGPTSFLFLELILEVWIGGFFLTDGGLGAVAAVDGGVVGQEGNDVVKAVHHVGVAAAVEIGTADALTEKGVAGEDYLLGFTIEEHGAGRMAGGGKDGELMAAEGDDVGGMEIWAYGRYVHLDGYSQDVAGLVGHAFHEPLVGGGGFWLKTVVGEDEVVAHAVVEMTMGAEQTAGL